MRITQYQPLAQVGPKSASFLERTTPDKWLPNEPKTFVRPAIAAAALLAATTALAFVPPVNAAKTWVERVQADKCYVEIQRPVKRFDLSRAQYSYYETRGGLFLVPFANGSAKTWAERTTPDKWHQLASEPRWDLPREQYLHPPHFTADRQQIPDLDSWVPQTNQPQFNLKRLQPLYPSSIIPDRQQEPDLDTWYQPASGFLPGRDLRVLRTGEYAWTALTVAPTEQILADKWHPASNVPGFDLTRKQSTYSAGALPDQQQFPDVDSWVPAANQPRFDLCRTQYGTPSYFTADQQQVPDLDSWWQQTSEFLRHPDRRVLRYGASEFALTPAQNIERTSPDKYWQQASEALRDVKRIQYLDPFYFAPERQADVRLDSWIPLPNLPRWDVSRKQFSYPVSVLPDLQPLARLDSWHPLIGQTQFDLKRVQYATPFLAFSQTLFAEGTTPDKYVPLENLPRWDVARSQYLATRTEWTSTFVANRVFPDSWHPEIRQPRFDSRRAHYVNEWWSADPALTVWTERTSPDRYLPLDNLPRWDVARRQWNYPTNGGPEIQSQPRLDNWLPLANQFQFDAKRLQALFPALSFAETIFQETSRPDKWHPLVNQPVFYPSRTQFLSARSEWVSTFVSNRVFPDSWHPESNKPQFDQKRIQALYPAFVAADLQSQPRVDSWWQQTQEFLRQPDRRVLRLGASELDLTPAQDVERSSIDKYYPGVQQPQFDLRRIQFGFAFTSFDPQPFPSPIFADSWHPLTGQPLFDRDRRIQRFGDSELTLAANQEPERITPDKWHPPIERRLICRTAILPENSSLPFTPRAIFVDSWWQQTNERLLVPPGRLYLAEFFTSGTATAERTSVDKYDAGTQRPQFDIARRQYLAQAFTSADRQTEPRFDSWYQPLSEGTRGYERRQYVALSSSQPERQPTITVDWLLQASEPLRAAHGIIEAGQGAPFTPERITVDKWYSTALDPSGRNAGLFLYPFYFSPDRQSTPRLESWYLAAGEPQRVSGQAIQRVTFAPIAARFETSIDQWQASIDQPVRNQRRVLSILDGFLFTPESITLDKWHTVGDSPRRTAIWTYAAPGYVVPELQSVPRAESWYVPAGEPRRLAKRSIQDGSALPVLTSVAEISVDEWHPLANQPSFDIGRAQYGYLVATFHPYPFPSRVGSARVGTSSAAISVKDQLAAGLGTATSTFVIVSGSGSLGDVAPSTRSGTVTLRTDPQS